MGIQLWEKNVVNIQEQRWVVLGRDRELKKEEGKPAWHCRKGHSDGFEQLQVLWHPRCPGNRAGFYRDSSFCCGDVRRFTRLHNELLVCRRTGEAGLSLKSTCVFCKVPTSTGLCFLVPLVELQSAQMIAWVEVAGTDPFKKALMSLDRHIFHAVCHEPGWVRTMRTGTERGAAEDQLPFVSLAVGCAACKKLRGAQQCSS